METREFEELKKKNVVLTKRLAENEAEIKSILRRLHDDFDIDSIEQAERVIKELDDKIEEDEKQYKIYLEQIKKAADWETIKC